MILNTFIETDSHKSIYVQVRKIMRLFDSENQQSSTIKTQKAFISSSSLFEPKELSMPSHLLF